jgi:hypothetical protein
VAEVLEPQDTTTAGLLEQLTEAAVAVVEAHPLAERKQVAQVVLVSLLFVMLIVMHLHFQQQVL